VITHFVVAHFYAHITVRKMSLLATIWDLVLHFLEEFIIRMSTSIFANL